MNLNALNGLQESLSAFWMERNIRERNAIILATVAVALGLVYSILIGPALTGRAQMDKTLPPLRQQVAQLQMLSKQATELAGVSAPPSVIVSKESVEAALKRAGLKSQNILVTGELTKVQLASASFAGIVNWLDEMQKKARLSVVEANIEALPAVDSVNATLTLRQQKTDKRDE